MNETDKSLGMHRPITRRDFLQGVTLSLAASRLGRTQERTGHEPPRMHGLRGQDFASTELGHRIRDGETELSTASVDTSEEYDLVVIGAGIAGLASAFVYHQEKKGAARILLLDNHDDFGGHARRNTFEWEGTTLIGPG
ncbi:MAG TPA: FAD/NAD(P)-binding protein, partial [Vicinamibacteria bacterium]